MYDYILMFVTTRASNMWLDK